MKVDLCSGGNSKPGFVGLDIRSVGDVEFVVDLNKGKLPFKDNSIEEFYEQNSFYELDNPMQIIKECHRCLKPNGILEFQEMYFASHYAFNPYTKNFWNFASARSFTKGYRGDIGWKILDLNFKTNNLPPKWLVNLNRNVYEKYFSRIMPVTYIIYKLQKV